MIPRSTFVSQPAVAFSELLSACNEILDHSVTTSVDSTVKKLSDSERFLSILSAMRDKNAPACLPPHLLTHISFSVLILSNENDMLDILEACGGMPFTYAETKRSGILVAVVTGNVQQWRDAIVTGTQHKHSELREGFNQMHNLFVEVGLHQVWEDFEQKPQDDGTYLLVEFKPS